MMIALLLLLACSAEPPSLEHPGSSGYHPPYQVGPEVWLYLPAGMSAPDRAWAGNAAWRQFTRWELELGPQRRPLRRVEVYVKQVVSLNGQQRVGVPAYLVEWGAVDGIFVTFGDRGTLPGLLRQLELVNTWPRDHWHQSVAMVRLPPPVGLVTRWRAAYLLEQEEIEGMKRVR